ncbi:unnamed protein product [Orchesella dallaii]|uniref:Uncharacterized protein n=1 Tax=Orchesella dallaii TaxID=48710 RepID=A0ABP1QF48_9HEXA
MQGPLVPSHTPRNHKALYYDLAKVTPDQKEKLRQSIPIDPFHSVELIEPAVGNFSKLLSGKAKEIELPILMDSKVFRKFLNLNQYQVLNQTVANLKNPRGRLETTDEQELVEDILEDILNKDANILKMVSPSQSSDEDVEQEGNHFTENIYEKRDSNNEAAYHHSVSDFDHLDFVSDEASETTAQGSHISIKKRSIFPPLSTVEENIATSIEGSNSNVPLALASNEEDIQYLDKAENPLFDFSLLIFPPNLNNTRSKHGFGRKFRENHKGKPLLGLCKGIHTPPECEDEQFRSNQGKHKKLEDDMEEIINGKARLADMMQRFNNATKKYGFFKHISSMFNKSVDLLCETCVIPVKVVTKESIKDALHLLLVGLDVNELKIGYRSRRISSEIIMKNGNRFLKACRNGSGLIDFLFEEKCPPRVSFKEENITYTEFK